MLKLWDDRAVQVIPNTGQPIYLPVRQPNYFNFPLYLLNMCARYTITQDLPGLELIGPHESCHCW